MAPDPTPPRPDIDADSPTIVPDASGTADAASLGEEFGDYELIEEIARGGMGVVYKARHRKLNRIVALKMILGGRFSSAEEIQRFHIEAEAAAKLDHPGIVPVYDIGEAEGQAFFAMKYIEGGSLADRLVDFRAEPMQAVQVLATVAAAVHHAHQRGILHRDLKPANILIDHDDNPLVTDLGLAKSTGGDSNLTKTGAVMGTPCYMPPEQAAAGQSLTTAADIYALGAILYEVLTGQPPHTGETTLDTLMSVLNSTPAAPRTRNPHADPELELICLKCIARDPEERYASAAELADDLERRVANEPISLKPPSLSAVASRWARQNRRLVYFLCSMLAGLALFVPPVLFLFGSASGMGDVYGDHFPDADPPWYVAFKRIPPPVAVGLFFVLVLLVWPSFGLWNAIVMRPGSVRKSMAVGATTSAVCAGLFVVTLGWIVAVVPVAGYSGRYIEKLGRAVWTPYGSTAEAERESANALFDGLEDVPESKRWYVVRQRVFDDQVARGPMVLLLLAGISSVIALPIMYGTVIAAILLNRKVRFWLVVLRYTLTWLATTIILTSLAVVAVFGIQPDQGVFLITALLASPVIAFLTMRRWVHPSSASTPALSTVKRPPTPVAG